MAWLATRRFWIMAAAALLPTVLAAAEDAAPARAPTPLPTPAATPEPLPAPAAVPPSAATPPMNAQQVIGMLDETIDWYRMLGVQELSATEPRDQLILIDNRRTAGQAVGAAFDIARAVADLIGQRPRPAAAANDTGQSLTQLHDKFVAQEAAVRRELDGDRRELANAPVRQRAVLESRVRELEVDADLIEARKSLVATMATFTTDAGSAGAAASSLRAQVEAMAVTLGPAGMGAAAPTAAPLAALPGSQPPPVSGASGSAAVRFGIWDLATNAVRLAEKVSTIESVDRRTAVLQDSFAAIRDPVVKQLKSLSEQADVVAAQVDHGDSAALDRTRAMLDALEGRFKQASALLIPLAREGVLLEEYRRNLGSWRDSVRGQYHDALKTLMIRVGALLALLALAFAASEVWRNAVLRYVQDPRRRYQFMLLRRVVLWFVVVLIVGIAFASELGSVVTFAGLLTAGLAVAMQSVLVSIVGYFFLIGKYGIRIGDRVQIGEVTGEVMELGLVRLYLMELGGRGLLGPTGRAVAFPNSIVFQVTTGLFKQIHGVDFLWREMVFALPAGLDYSDAKERIAAAVRGALEDYDDEIVRQSRELKRVSASGWSGDAAPSVALNFSAAGVEAHVRYPVDPQHAADVDERVSREVMRAIGGLQPAART